ncbi:hypothetical protein BX616_008799 [Lobosporangium transversale]|uniref:Phage tail tube protein n=1 Tax=Lobosporangium transversale TaxID=64571 RepID=A0A1Y2GH66_9FUNG|nr:hypothetical protein BCR41DRAFT_372433 [Lobosporangium transversale]KAF9914182.1 hypothetical protein BX616_008799 [Lobosporangium transversale]ORZ10689.1 hypothetical protein BCR41DRAFT_372433 [Lobosporangium transversale]|eukprot:XP_021879410.1 hypothetical protein BCR41DRAFT_372433 [Lobosporangium transversale]
MSHTLTIDGRTSIQFESVSGLDASALETKPYIHLHKGRGTATSELLEWMASDTVKATPKNVTISSPNQLTGGQQVWTLTEAKPVLVSGQGVNQNTNEFAVEDLRLSVADMKPQQ